MLAGTYISTPDKKSFIGSINVSGFLTENTHHRETVPYSCWLNKSGRLLNAGGIDIILSKSLFGTDLGTNISKYQSFIGVNKYGLVSLLL
jgi:hypothetical protein